METVISDRSVERISDYHKLTPKIVREILKHVPKERLPSLYVDLGVAAREASVKSQQDSWKAILWSLEDDLKTAGLDVSATADKDVAPEELTFAPPLADDTGCQDVIDALKEIATQPLPLPEVPVGETHPMFAELEKMYLPNSLARGLAVLDKIAEEKGFVTRVIAQSVDPTFCWTVPPREGAFKALKGPLKSAYPFLRNRQRAEEKGKTLHFDPIEYLWQLTVAPVPFTVLLSDGSAASGVFVTTAKAAGGEICCEVDGQFPGKNHPYSVPDPTRTDDQTLGEALSYVVPSDKFGGFQPVYVRPMLISAGMLFRGWLKLGKGKDRNAMLNSYWWGVVTSKAILSIPQLVYDAIAKERGIDSSIR